LILNFSGKQKLFQYIVSTILSEIPIIYLVEYFSSVQYWDKKQIPIFLKKLYYNTILAALRIFFCQLAESANPCC